ncbi:MAG: hypothetical protein NT131_00510 [Methanomassiliicoccales archaeon]|nr:hypothetical protein [Methanomassiliicoccales archaeon]
MNDNEWACGKDTNWRSMKGLSWRITFSALSIMVWFAFVIAWLFFLADDYGVLQNIGVLLLSVVTVAAINIPVWMSFARSMGEVPKMSCEKEGHDMAGGALGLIWVVAVGLWLFFYANDYSIYQNLAVLLLSIAPVAAASMLMKR